MTDKKIRTFAFAALGLGLALTAHAAHVHASSKAIYYVEGEKTWHFNAELNRPLFLL